MNNPQVVVEVIDVDWDDSMFDECVEQLMFLWINERGLPYIERIWFIKETADE